MSNYSYPGFLCYWSEETVEIKCKSNILKDFLAKSPTREEFLNFQLCVKNRVILINTAIEGHSEEKLGNGFFLEVTLED